MDSYVCSGAMMKCSMGTAPARLTVLPIRTVMLTGQPMANISDHLTMVNLAPFGTCRSLGFPATASATAAAQGALTPMPCVHNTPFPWMGGKMDYLVQNQPALLKSSTCQCMWGGTISLINDGQIPQGPANLSRKPPITPLVLSLVDVDIPKNHSDLSSCNIDNPALQAIKDMPKDQYDELFKKVKRQRMEKAKDFYEKERPKKAGTRDEFGFYSHMNGIDFNHPVEVVELPPPNEVYQYATEGSDKPGAYVIIPPVEPPVKYGIHGTNRVLRKLQFNENAPKTKFLKSTASNVLAPLDGNWGSNRNDKSNWVRTEGGGIQLHSSETRSVLSFSNQ